MTAAAGVLLVWFANRPGRMSFDSWHQLRQVLGEIPLDDWHPAVMTWTWRLLYETTGSVGAMAAAQIVLGFGSALVLALVLYEVTRSRPLSFGAVAIMFLPNVINFIGVLWKDTQMMLAYFACVVALIAVRKVPSLHPTLRVVLVVFAVGCLLYGTLVRYNAVFATIPLVILIVDTWRYRRSGEPPAQSRKSLAKHSIIGVVGFAILLVVTSSLFSALVRPTDTSSTSALHLDGIIFTVPADEIRGFDIPDELKQKLLDAQRKCIDEGVIVDSYWKCYGRGATGQPFEAVAFKDEIRDLWMGKVLTRPDRYLPYQAQTFAQFLSTSSFLALTESFSEVPPEWRGVPNRPNEILKAYVLGVGVDTLPWLYRAWFWLLTSVVVLGLSGKAKSFRLEIRALAASAALYLLGYAVYAPVNDYRYSYWAAVASTLAVLLLLVDRHLSRSTNLPSTT
jgi:hypothetical protein